MGTTTAVAIVYRSFIFLYYGYSHFDSDQAIVGLMARHIAEGRSFPIFYYGQQYLLAVESWLAAPFFWVLGSSILTLKLPLLFLNVAAVFLFLKVLANEVKLDPVASLGVVSFFAIPSVVFSSRLIEAQGGNIELWLYVPLIWMLRKRPWILGVLLGFALRHREFSLYPALALMLVDGFSRKWLKVIPVALVIYFAITLLTHSVGPVIGPAGPGGMGFNPHPGRAVLFIFQEYIPAFLGTSAASLESYNIQSAIAGWPLWWARATSLLAVLTCVWVSCRTERTTGFSKYLVLSGLFSLGFFIVFSPTTDLMSIRYVLLLPLIPTGLCIEVFKKGKWKRPALTATALFALGHLVQTTNLIREFSTEPPRDFHTDVLSLLKENNLNVGTAPYWYAYYLDFISRETITIASTDHSRIPEYQEKYAQTPRRFQLYEKGVRSIEVTDEARTFVLHLR